MSRRTCEECDGRCWVPVRVDIAYQAWVNDPADNARPRPNYQIRRRKCYGCNGHGYQEMGPPR